MFGTIKLFFIAAIVLTLCAGMWWVANLKADLATSEANNQKLQDSVSKQQEVIDKAYQDIEEIKSINDSLRTETDRQQAELKALNDKFTTNAKGEKRDFGATAVAKPKLVEKLINRGTHSVVRCLEIASGSPLTESEINAKKSSEANRECPTLANPNYNPVIK